MALDLKEIKKLSKNPVQQDYIEQIDRELCDNGEDIFDFANQVAALRKYADHLEKENSEYFHKKVNAKKTTFKKAVEFAMNDWKGYKEKAFDKDFE